MDSRTREVFSQFRKLSKALIDASSIIYMHKAGFLGELASAVTLYSPQEILAEAGLDDVQIHQLTSAPTSLSNDRKLIACALELRLPVISEDRKILLSMKREKIPYFNALMMLNFLLVRRAISLEDYSRYYQHLKDCSRYSPKVLQFGQDIYAVIVRERDN